MGADGLIEAQTTCYLQLRITDLNFLWLLSNKYFIQGAAAILFVLSAWGYGAWKYSSGYDDAQQERSMADLVAYVGESNRLALLANELEARIAELRDVQPKIIERYNRVVVEKPLPVDCRLDIDRMQHITRAIEAANSDKPSQPLPKN